MLLLRFPLLSAHLPGALVSSGIRDSDKRLAPVLLPGSGEATSKAEDHMQFDS